MHGPSAGGGVSLLHVMSPHNIAQLYVRQTRRLSCQLLAIVVSCLPGHGRSSITACMCPHCSAHKCSVCCLLNMYAGAGCLTAAEPGRVQIRCTSAQDVSRWGVQAEGGEGGGAGGNMPEPMPWHSAEPVADGRWPLCRDDMRPDARGRPACCRTSSCSTASRSSLWSARAQVLRRSGSHAACS